MIGRLFANDGANAVMVVVLSGTIVTLVAHGPGRVPLGQAPSGVLSNPVPRHVPSGAREGLSSPASGRGAAA